MSDGYPYYPAHGSTDTSAEAAHAMEGISARVQRLALAAINSSGDAGLTAHELALVLNMERTTVQPRTSELSLLGRIEDSGTRRLNPNGKRAIVWIATNPGEPA